MLDVTTKEIILSNKKQLFKITMFMLLANIVSQGIPTLIKVLSDKIVDFNIPGIVLVCLFIILLGFIKYFSDIIADKYYFQYINKIGNDLLENLLKSILRLKNSKIKSSNPDTLLRVATDDIMQMKNSIVKEFFISISTIVSIITLLFFVIKLDYKLAAVTILWYFIYYFLSNKIISSISKKRKSERENYTDIVSYSKDIILGANDFKYFSNLDLIFNKIKNVNSAYNESNINLMVSSSMARYLTHIGSFTNIAIILMYKYFFASDVSTGVLLAMYMYTTKYADVFEQILFLKTLKKDNKELLKPYNELLTKSEDSGIKIENTINSISLKDLTIKYENKEIVTKFNQNFLAGKIYIISGTSGKGKTSILNSILGEIDYEGTVCINDININQISRDSINLKFAYLNQNVYLINGTIKDNIYMFNEETESMNSLINTFGFPDLDYYLGNSEIDKVSGGERKRIEFARLFRCIKEKDVILIDETFVNLDKENIKKVISMLKNYAENKVIIVVSHDDYVKDLFRTDQTEYVNL